MNSDQAQSASSHRDLPSEAAAAAQPDLKDPRVVLSLLEADQVVAAKSQTHFGRRALSSRERILLWGLRIYVVVMLVIVTITVIQAVGASH
ncbi:MAG TPA: hypothetical protein VNY97_04745 [Candidatus Angelobacter sp.]|nr:hypothetical protein [Candidatus Angelobacter sp.]